MGDFNSNKILEDFFIPDYILVAGSKVGSSSHVPACPVIVFINSKSGGQLGGELLVAYRSLLNKNQFMQVYDGGLRLGFCIHSPCKREDYYKGLGPRYWHDMHS